MLGRRGDQKMRTSHSQPRGRGWMVSAVYCSGQDASPKRPFFGIPPVASLKDLMTILCKTAVPSNLKQFGIMLDFDKTFLDYIKVKNQKSHRYVG